MHCINPSVYLSCVLDSLIIMMNLALPHINILSKIDLFKSLDTLKLPIEFYLDLCDLKYLSYFLENDFRTKKLKKLTDSIISDTFCMSDVLRECDKANSYIIGSCNEDNPEYLCSLAYTDTKYDRCFLFFNNYFYNHIPRGCKIRCDIGSHLGLALLTFYLRTEK
ncbi:hypothetical protein HZS_3417 [Henneguya salminicola]|nr:hypothetical protein HZS_3417 [Henneguya salminicola]